jgi:hypothetical protein
MAVMLHCYVMQVGWALGKGQQAGWAQPRAAGQALAAVVLFRR